MKLIKKYKSQIGYFIKNAPLAIITSALPGAVNYAVILFLTAFYTFEDVGTFRLMMSYFALLGLFSLKESSKVQVRAQADGNERSSSTLFYARLYTIGITTLIIALLSLLNLKLIPSDLIWIALFSCLAYPAELFLPALQAEKRFTLLAGLSFIKYLGSLSIFVIIMIMDYSITLSCYGLIGFMSISNVVFYALYLGRTLNTYTKETASPLHVIKDKDTKESFTLSFANWLPGTLEHVDKMIIGAVFGLEVLGLYTLCFSTGRFIYNALKPAFYIYYRHFVDKLPGKKLLWIVTAAFTGFGAGLSLIFFIGTLFIPFFEKFSGGEAVVYILFLSYGIAMADAVYTQSYGINKSSKANHLLVANTAISLACLGLFALCPILSVQIALIICAAHYPIRHAGTILILSMLKNRSEKA